MLLGNEISYIYEVNNLLVLNKIYLKQFMKKLFLLLLVFSVTAQADLLCVKNRVKVRNNAINLSNNVKVVNDVTCPARHSLVKDLKTIQDQQIAAFAKVDSSGAVKSFGGTGVNGISVDTITPGRFEISFFGNFTLSTESDSEQNRNMLTINSSAIADNYGVTNNSVVSASNSEIRVVVFLWKSDSNADQNQSGINVNVLKGILPLL